MSHSVFFVQPETSFQDALGQPIRPIVYFHFIVYEKESNGLAESVTLRTGCLTNIFTLSVLSTQQCVGRRT
jgi:hypothetical protein